MNEGRTELGWKVCLQQNLWWVCWAIGRWKYKLHSQEASSPEPQHSSRKRLLLTDLMIKGIREMGQIEFGRNHTRASWCTGFWCVGHTGRWQRKLPRPFPTSSALSDSYLRLHPCLSVIALLATFQFPGQTLISPTMRPLHILFFSPGTLLCDIHGGLTIQVPSPVNAYASIKSHLITS